MVKRKTKKLFIRKRKIRGGVSDLPIFTSEYKGITKVCPSGSETDKYCKYIVPRNLLPDTVGKSLFNKNRWEDIVQAVDTKSKLSAYNENANRLLEAISQKGVGESKKDLTYVAPVTAPASQEKEEEKQSLLGEKVAQYKRPSNIDYNRPNDEDSFTAMKFRDDEPRDFVPPGGWPAANGGKRRRKRITKKNKKKTKSVVRRYRK